MRAYVPDSSPSTRRRQAHRRSWLAAVAASILLATLTTGTATAARPAAMAADDPTVLTDWNALAVTTLVGDTTKMGPVTFLYMGFVQAAVYDAVVGVEGRYAPYRFHAHPPRGTSSQAAAVAAAHKVLVTYSPYAQANLDAAYAASLARLPDGEAKRRGVAFGTRAAEHLIRLRANDGQNAPIEFTRPPAPGVWRPTPPAFAPMIAPWLGFVTPLLVRGPTQFAPPAPPKLTSARTRHLRLTLISTAVPGVQRHYDSGPALRRDVVNARIWLGIHFRFADTAARSMGVRLADWTLAHYFQPLHGHRGTR
jgi:hypothetical protein